ncbi:MAG: hypothetical protein U0414_11970 [Polyangiaceae bacterium]
MILASALAASCQLVAGVETDGELRTGSTGTASSAGGATTSTATSTSTTAASSSSTGTYMGPVCAGAPCDGKCLRTANGDACFVGTCTGSAPFELFSASDLDDTTLEDAIAVAVSNGKLVIVVTDTSTHTAYIRALDDGGAASTVLKYPVAKQARFTWGRFVGASVGFAGIVDGDVAELRVGFAGGPPVNASLALQERPAPCGAAEPVDRALFAEIGVQELAYAANCGENGVSYKLVTGREGTAAELVDFDKASSSKLALGQYAVMSDAQLILTGSGLTQTFFRHGVDAAALATAKPFRISTAAENQPSTLFLGQLQGNLQATFGWYGADLDATNAAALWSGVFGDPSAALSSVPPGGFVDLAAGIAAADFASAFGAGSQAQSTSTNNGVFIATPTYDQGTINLGWLHPDGGPPLVRNTPIYETKNRITAVGIGDFGLLNQVGVVWVEKSGMTSVVKAQIETCTAAVK